LHSWSRRTRTTFAAAVFVLFGLLAMHGWGTHGSNTHEATSAPPVGAMSHVMVPDTGHPEPGRDQSGLRSDDRPDAGGWLMGLCLAALTALFLGLAFLLARNPVAVPVTMLPPVPPALFRSRDRDPPDLYRLCVMRC
jgi:hypothetical protein